MSGGVTDSRSAARPGARMGEGRPPSPRRSPHASRFLWPSSNAGRLRKARTLGNRRKTAHVQEGFVGSP